MFRHNIRNDLNGIRGYAGVLCEHVEGHQPREHLETSREASRHLIVISEKLKMGTRVDTDRPGERPVNVVDVVREELEALRAGKETELARASSVGLWLVAWLCRLYRGSVEFSTEGAKGTSVRLCFRHDTAAVRQDGSRTLEAPKAIPG